MGKTTVSGSFPMSRFHVTGQQQTAVQPARITMALSSKHGVVQPQVYVVLIPKNSWLFEDFFGIFWSTWFYLRTTPDPRIFNCQLAQSSIGDLNSASEVQANRLPGLMRFVRWKVYGLKLTYTKMSGFRLLSIAWAGFLCFEFQGFRMFQDVSGIPKVHIHFRSGTPVDFLNPFSQQPIRNFTRSFGIKDFIWSCRHSNLHPPHAETKPRSLWETIGNHRKPTPCPFWPYGFSPENHVEHLDPTLW